MRGFVGLEIPDAARQPLSRAVRRLRHALPPARWIPATNWHLTLVFLGRLEKPDLAGLEVELAPVFAGRRAFELEIGEPGTFPPNRPARVVWIGLKPSDPLRRLQDGVTEACARLDFEVERRPYSPHLTIARCRKPWPKAAVDLWLGYDLGAARGLAFGVDRGCLFESVPGRGGVRYEVLRAFPLSGSEAPT